jgi:hypothetical protein
MYFGGILQDNSIIISPLGAIKTSYTVTLFDKIPNSMYLTKSTKSKTITPKARTLLFDKDCSLMLNPNMKKHS